VRDITLMLRAAQHGETAAVEQLMRAVYDELRALARAKMAREAGAIQTLQPTALVHEAWLRLGGDAQPEWQSRRHFFGAAAEAMRRILIERARRSHAARHGGGMERIEFDTFDLVVEEKGEQLLALNDALDRLAIAAPSEAELVKLRYFAGLSFAEAAQALAVSERTAKRWWAFARAWLHAEMLT
jgi:RNA polymerase sigma factor (TIGR02999 family)